MSGSLINVAGIRNIISLPAYIFDDSTVSLAAKGIFAQLCYSASSILSLSDICKFTNDSEETVTKYINELIDTGYIVQDAKGNFHLRPKALSTKTIDKNENTDEIKESIKNTTVTPKKNAFDFIRDRVISSDFPDSIKKLLIEYFTRWLHGEDRFANQPLHKNMVDGKIKNLIEIKNTYSLEQAEIEQCVKQSIENHWYKFIWPLVEKSNNFDKSKLVSGSYTQEEIEEVKRKARERLEESINE